jgi:hypothetical protein
MARLNVPVANPAVSMASPRTRGNATGRRRVITAAALVATKAVAAAQGEGSWSAVK